MSMTSAVFIKVRALNVGTKAEMLALMKAEGHRRNLAARLEQERMHRAARACLESASIDG
jgi:hypothetical protein